MMSYFQSRMNPESPSPLHPGRYLNGAFFAESTHSLLSYWYEKSIYDSHPPGRWEENKHKNLPKCVKKISMDITRKLFWKYTITLGNTGAFASWFLGRRPRRGLRILWKTLYSTNFLFIHKRNVEQNYCAQNSEKYEGNTTFLLMQFHTTLN